MELREQVLELLKDKPDQSMPELSRALPEWRPYEIVLALSDLETKGVIEAVEVRWTRRYRLREPGEEPATPVKTRRAIRAPRPWKIPAIG